MDDSAEMEDGTSKGVPVFGADIRREFMLRDDISFLNHASYGGIPKCVHDRQVRYLQEMEGHTDYWFRFNYPRYLQSALRKVADFIGVNVQDTVLVQNVTKAINNVLKTFPLHSGDAVLITTLTYGAVRCIAQATVERVKGTKVHTLDILFPIKSEDDIVNKYEEFLDGHPDVKIAVIDHITSPTSVIFPVKRLVDVCHHHGVIVVVDGAHAPGILTVDLSYIDADFYTGNMHKWVFAPRSCAFLWMNPRCKHGWFKPLVTSAYEYQGLDKAFAYEGTKDGTAYLCCCDGIDYYNRIGGMEKIMKYTTHLREKGVAYLERAWKTTALDIPNTMVAPNMQLIHIPPLPKYSDLTNLELLKLLADRFKVQVAVEYVEGKLMIRVSTQVYNTMEDFVKLAEAILTLSSDLAMNSEHTAHAEAL